MTPKRDHSYAKSCTNTHTHTFIVTQVDYTLFPFKSITLFLGPMKTASTFDATVSNTTLFNNGLFYHRRFR